MLLTTFNKYFSQAGNVIYNMALWLCQALYTKKTTFKNREDINKKEHQARIVLSNPFDPCKLKASTKRAGKIHACQPLVNAFLL